MLPCVTTFLPNMSSQVWDILRLEEASGRTQEGQKSMHTLQDGPLLEYNVYSAGTLVELLTPIPMSHVRTER